MPPRPPALALALGLAIAMSPPAAAALETNVPRALAEAHFGQLYAFNMVGAYESSHRDAKLRFVVARRVTPERSELLMHVRAPASVQEKLPERWRGPLGEHYAFLLIHNRGRSDDLLVYVPPLLRVHRLPAPELQKQPMGHQRRSDDEGRRSGRLHAEEQGPDQPRGSERDEGAGQKTARNRQEDATHHEAADVRSASPECQANADLFPPPTHRVGHDAEDADDGEQDGQPS